MSRIADALERESRSVELADGGFERLLARRDRKQRNRRIRAGAVGVILALATAAALARSIAWERMPAIPPKPVGAGEVLTGATALVARNPDNGATRTIVASESIPRPSGETITSASWSHDHDWVAFRLGSGSQGGDLWIADTTGGEPRRIATDVGWAPWVWSPTADQLVFVLGREMTLVDAASGRTTDLGTIVGAKDIEGYAVHVLVWSPDGTSVVYDGGQASGSVYSVDVRTGEHTLLVRKPDGMANIDDIDWAPDGAHLAITNIDASTLDRQVVYVVDADGSDPTPAEHKTGSQWPVWMPGTSVGTVWSPDGTRLAYATLSGKDHEALQVWTVSPDGSDPLLVTSRCCVTDGGGPVWSPDGSQIAFSAEYDGGTPSVRLDYLVAHADGTGDPVQTDEWMRQSWDGGWYFCFCYG
jgi:Tol biopolymer transport system component